MPFVTSSVLHQGVGRKHGKAVAVLPWFAGPVPFVLSLVNESMVGQYSKQPRYFTDTSWSKTTLYTLYYIQIYTVVLIHSSWFLFLFVITQWFCHLEVLNLRIMTSLLSASDKPVSKLMQGLSIAWPWVEIQRARAMP